jgi:hypothetical protein
MDGKLRLSFQVLVVPEDPTHNGDILNPLISRMMTECGKPNAKVVVLTDPKVQGYNHARQQLPDIIDRYRHFDLILFLVDADGKDRSAVFREMEKASTPNSPPLFCAAAVQEVEVWLLAGHTQKLDRPWETCEATFRSKKTSFGPFC